MLNRIFSFFVNTGPLLLSLLFIVMILTPVPVLLLDILIGLNLIIAFSILFRVVRIRSVNKVLPTVILGFTIFNLVLSIGSVRLILTQGADYNGWWIRLLSSMVVGPEAGGMIAGFIIFLVFYAIQMLVFNEGAARVSEIAAGLARETMEVKLLAFKTESESDVLQEVDSLISLNGVIKYITGNAKAVFFITMTIIIGGVFIGIFTDESFSDRVFRPLLSGDFTGILADETIKTALRTYGFLALGFGIIFLLPPLSLSLAVGISVSGIIGVHYQNLELVRMQSENSLSSGTP